MQIGILSYNCTCCNSPVHIPVMDGKCLNIFGKMFDTKKCLRCHAEKHIPETAEILQGLL